MEAAASNAAASAGSSSGGEPAALPVADDFRGPVRGAGDHGQAAGHRLDQCEPERLGDRGEDEQVARVQCLGQLLVRTPAGEEDVRDADLSDRLERMLAFPFAGVTADEDERAGPLGCGLGAGVGADQERQPLDGREAAEVEEDRLRREGGELLVPIRDGARPPLFVPALWVLDEPAMPEGAARLPGERGRLEAFELDAAGKAM